jgi:hypothetical protein
MNKITTIRLVGGALILFGLFFYWLQGGPAVDSVPAVSSETSPAIPVSTDLPVVTEPVADLPVPPSPLEPVVASEACYVGGCSGQVCSGEEWVSTDCRYLEAYACYKPATCERQATGACGWTQSPTLVACLAATAEGSSFE